MRAWRFPPLRAALALLLLALLLAGVDALCYRVTLPVELDAHGNVTTLTVDGQRVVLGTLGQPVALTLVPRDPVVHEYQLDGTDSTNNFTLDLAYLHSISDTPYYRFQSWMRDLDGLSRWGNLHVWAEEHEIHVEAAPPNNANVALPAATSLRVTLELQRPETPVTLVVTTASGAYTALIDRNDRAIIVTRFDSTSSDAPTSSRTFFPMQSAPFAAMVLDFLARTLFWGGTLVLVALAIECWLALTWFALADYIGSFSLSATGGHIWQRVRTLSIALRGWVSRLTLPTRATPVARWTSGRWRALTAALHPLALAALAGSLIFVAWIARVEYAGLPHIYDASAYLFGAKIYATGHLWLPVPPASDRFPGPFMALHDGKWFPQYVPGTSLLLALGVKLGAPWLIEPVLGTLALLGIGLTVARLYDRRTATLAVILGTLSPFYSYLAASYMSHTVALFFLAWGFWALVRFAQGEAGWHLPLAVALFGAAALTREQVPLLFAGVVIPGILLLHRRHLRWWHGGCRWLVPVLAALGVVSLCVLAQMAFDTSLTGDPLVTPRLFFNPADHYGFGIGVGFYGQHTIAAGFITLDELLTSLAIDLYGWPFYLTLALLYVPFLTRRARPADWLLLVGAAVMTGAYIGFFYHGIYLGPRFLYETLPFLLPLTARGIVALGQTGVVAGHDVSAWFALLGTARRGCASLARRGDATGEAAKHVPGPRWSVAAVIIVGTLLACNLFYYLPRQIALYDHYTGLPAGQRVNLAQITAPPFHHAIIVTSNYQLYGYTLFALNDPYLRGDLLYAFGSTPADYEELRQAFPGRALFLLVMQPSGGVQYVPIAAG